MKYFLVAFSLLIGTQAVASLQTELTGQCLGAAELAITELGSNEEPEFNEATIEEVYLAKKGYMEVSYSRPSEESMITGEAALKFEIYKFARDRNKVIISDCKILQADILDERAD